MVQYLLKKMNNNYARKVNSMKKIYRKYESKLK